LRIENVAARTRSATVGLAYILEKGYIIYPEGVCKVVARGACRAQARHEIDLIIFYIRTVFGRVKSESSIHQNACRKGIYAIARRKKCILYISDGHARDTERQTHWCGSETGDLGKKKGCNKVVAQGACRTRSALMSLYIIYIVGLIYIERSYIK
jgi:hypothetical protein